MDEKALREVARIAIPFVVRTRIHRGTSAALCVASRSLITASVALLRRSRFMAGGTDVPDAPDPARLARTLDKTRRGGLPAPIEGKLYAGRSSLQMCNGCGDKIASAETEYEVEIGEVITFRFHTGCYQAWKSFPMGN